MTGGTSSPKASITHEQPVFSVSWSKVRKSLLFFIGWLEIVFSRRR